MHTVAWNPMHRRVFLTASADWTVQLWDADIMDKVISPGIKLYVACGILLPPQHNTLTWVYSSRFKTSCISDGNANCCWDHMRPIRIYLELMRRATK